MEVERQTVVARVGGERKGERHQRQRAQECELERAAKRRGHRERLAEGWAWRR